MRDGLDSAEVILQSKMLVWSVGIFVGQAKTDQHARDFEGVVHLRNKRD